MYNGDEMMFFLAAHSGRAFCPGVSGFQQIQLAVIDRL
jgi:hypothetical protein